MISAATPFDPVCGKLVNAVAETSSVFAKESIFNIWPEAPPGPHKIHIPETAHHKVFIPETAHHPVLFHTTAEILKIIIAILKRKTGFAVADQHSSLKNKE